MIRAFLSVLLVGWAPLAHAQQPMALPGVPPAGETAFAVEDTDSQRFFAVDETSKGPSLSAGEAVTVVLRTEDRVRFLVRGRFGWVPAAALSAQPPAAPETTAPGVNDPLLPPG